jgi:hypothetical protein
MSGTVTFSERSPELQWEARAVSTFSGGRSGTTNFIGAVAAALVLLVFSATGVLSATRRPDNVIGRLLLATGIVGRCSPSP